MLASVFLAQCQLRYFFLISLFVIYYLGLRSCKHLLRGNKEFKGSGLWQVLCKKKKEVLARLKLKQGCQLLKKLHHLAAERIFVLEMKKKYAGK